MKPSFKNKSAFLRKVDLLPVGPEWICNIISVVGDEIGPDGQPLTEEVELWRRNPVDCCKDLIGNLAFLEYIAYSPIKVTRDGSRYYGEMNTADWWWDTQLKLPAGSVVAPIILASDKTNLTVFCGDKTAWPVYLTIGNIDKDVRRKPSAHATILLGYIPVSKLACFKKKTRSEAQYRLFHTCMVKILDPLVTAGKTGIPMTCADGHIRCIYPILAAYVTDHPEQCLIACCQENRCPRCVIPRKQRGDRKEFPLRDHGKTADMLRRAGEGDPPMSYTVQGLWPVYQPFWADLPHTDIFACIAPDILHQLHKGVIKDHLLVWCQKIVGKKTLDERLAALSKCHGLRHFQRGISVISQWTGSKVKELEKVLLSLLVRQVEPSALKAIRALLDFTYYAQYEVHSDETLARMQKALNTFHRHKRALIALGVREHFNIPKLHSLIHYVKAIQQLGCLDGLNTETSERLHIDYAKKAYRASSRREYVAQMTSWLQRQEAIERQSAYLAWIHSVLERELEETLDDEYESGVEDVDNNIDEDRGSGDQDETDIKALRELLHSNASCAYQLPLAPSAHHVPLDHLHSSYATTDFLLELNKFLSEHRPSGPPATENIKIDTFHSLCILLPLNIHIVNVKRICKVRAAPSKPRFQDRKAVPAQFDCALFVVDEDAFRDQGGLTGLRAGQVHVIFRLPDHLNYNEPLVYLNWFRPFRTANRTTDLPPTSHSIRAHKRNVSILKVSDILRPCHLVPKFQGSNTSQWAAEDILNEPLTFLLNRYIDFHMFDMLMK
ncbi:hypothetical protein C8Q73DRAFT_636509 [Cubamyces lactineus]|nr:hypothetical protein C8Q73DRAFT_636509 [Cubamyces lactineus]